MGVAQSFELPPARIDGVQVPISISRELIFLGRMSSAVPSSSSRKSYSRTAALLDYLGNIFARKVLICFRRVFPRRSPA
jgi:hypothetical protein